MADSSLAQIDRDITTATRMIIQSSRQLGKNIDFQFPVHIASESKSSNWNSKNLRSYEPLKYYNGSEARKLNVEFEYIATDREFTPEKISGILRDLKAYFYNAFVIAKKGSQQSYPIVEFSAYEVVPPSAGFAKFRMMSFNATYSKEKVSVADKIFPLHTLVSMDLELATTIEPTEAAGGTTTKKALGKIAAGLVRINPEWF